MIGKQHHVMDTLKESFHKDKRREVAHISSSGYHGLRNINYKICGNMVGGLGRGVLENGGLGITS